LAQTLPRPKRNMLDRLAPLILIAITILGAILRLYDIGSKGLWIDEAFSVWMGWQSLEEMLHWLVKIDQHPPLYYTLLHFWLNMGDNAAMVRAFSALIGVVTIPIVYRVGYRLGGRNIGLLAATILAISPFHVRFAQETRMYTLLSFNASLAMLALVYLLTDSRSATIPIGQQLSHFNQIWGETPAATKRLRRFSQAISTDLAWLGYIFFTVATLLTHNTAIFFPIATNLFIFGLIFLRYRKPGNADSLQPPALKNWLVAQVAVFLLWSPWLVSFVIQSSGVYKDFWIADPTVAAVFWTLKNFVSPLLPGQVTQGNLVWGLYGLIIVLGIWHLRGQPGRLLLLLTLFLAPIIGELLVSIRRPIFYDRTLIWATIPLYLLLAAGINQLRYRPYILVAIIMLATINGLSLREYYFKFEKEQWDDAAQYVAQHAGHDDLILFNATWTQIPFDYYFRRFNHPATEHGLPVDMFERDVLEPKMTPADLPRMWSLVGHHERIWLIYSHDWYTDPTKIIPSELSQALELLDKQSFQGLEVHLYSKPND
jgi:mannosyltransferase